MKITLVEDDQTMRNLLKKLLELEGHTVTICIDKNETDIVQRIFSDLPEVVILDVHLSGADGMSIVKNIKKRTCDAVKVVMISGLPLEEECLEAGADHFLIKPFLPDDLLVSIQQMK